MWKITKESGGDLSFAIDCLFSQSIDINDFKRWLEKVILDIPLDKIPLFVYDLYDFNGELADIDNIIGFVPHSDITNEQYDAILGIAFLRGKDVYKPRISKSKAIKLLKKHSEIHERFRKFFPFIELPELIN
ncbi:hypothetical protein [Rodentibacter pneumotropicus]|uniref:Uncharacterized protein n=1 Tax=Rodentibacter pneumotropicus TaxID=758 RepID=A0A4S2QGK6_9PAST|nr:hypothetical protein [Rodentibacter pneumotropicus]THA02387.1 hypothetical protein D3M74_03870 [Rodentibacter pneumotropicus]THA16252.1 hypothetical protein D3M76_03610 [Rodentibacter pneumotropicus]